MSEKKGDSFAFPWPALLAVVTLGGGALFLTQSLTTSRPVEAGSKPLGNLGVEDVPARLWQDPLKASHDDLDTLNWLYDQKKYFDQREENHKVSKLADVLVEEAKEEGGHVLILPVLINGSRSPGQTERRLRTRHAVLSGLARCGYAPTTPEYIGYTALFWPAELPTATSLRWLLAPACQAESSSKFDVRSRLVVPYEWCEPTSGVTAAARTPRASKILILWLRNEAFADKPFSRLQRLFDSLEQPAWQKQHELRIIGPPNSDDLKKMIEEADASMSSKVRGAFAGATMIAAVPTASDDLLLSETPTEKAVIPEFVEGKRRAALLRGLYRPTETVIASSARRPYLDLPNRRVEQYIEAALNDDWRPQPDAQSPPIQFATVDNRRKFRFVRTIGTDDLVARQLVHELKLRGVDVSPNGKANVAIISEWDTFYGRALPHTFAAAATRKGPVSNALPSGGPPNHSNPTTAATTTAANGQRESELPWIHRYGYMGGLDGRLPGDGAEKASGPKASSSGDAVDRSSRPMEQPEGSGQFDYLRRLADQLDALNRQLIRDTEQTEGAPRGLRAVGVLGSDLYDKLLVMRALRERLPGVLFFTNNLDARLAHAAEWPATHNLIIGSPFGLTLSQRYQGMIPPFRDSYQTSVYAATLMAVGFVPDRPSDIDRPRVFEVGRDGARDLSTGSSPETSATVGNASVPAATYPADASAGGAIHPPRADSKSWWSEWRKRQFRWLMGGLFVFLLLCLLLPKGEGDLKRQRAESWSRWILRRLVRTLFAHTLVFLVLAAGVVAAGLYLAYEHQRRQLPFGGGEAFALFDGTSVWPTEAIRVFAALLCLHFLIKSWLAIRDNGKRIAQEFCLALEPRTWTHPQGYSRPSGWRAWIPSGIRRVLGLPLAAGRERSSLAKAEAGSIGEPLAANAAEDFGASPVGPAIPASPTISDTRPSRWARFCRAVNRARIRAVRTLLPYRLRRDFRRRWPVFTRGGKVDVERLWGEYLRRGMLLPRTLRILPVAAAYLVTSALLFSLFGHPAVPARGDFSRKVDAFAVWSIVIAYVVLMFSVVDATQLNERFIHYLSIDVSRWPRAAIAKCRERRKLEPNDLVEYLDITLIARRTAVVGKLIYYPFIVLALMIVSRIAYFDNWDWPASLVLVLAFNAGYAVICALVLRNAAEKARRNSLRRVREDGISYAACKKSSRAEAARATAQEIEAIDEGAFASFAKHPVMGALLLPTGGVGIWALVEHLARFT